MLKRFPIYGAVQLPDVPTMAELGFSGFEGSAWFGLLAPAKTPKHIIDWLNKQAIEIFTAQENREIFTKQGMNVPLGSPEDFAAYIEAESQRWRGIIQKSGVKLQ